MDFRSKLVNKMKNAQQILESKGYDLNEIIDIFNYTTKHSAEGLDMKVRTEFQTQDLPIHLWESYYIGDANEEELLKIANEQNFDSIDTLFRVMNARLIELCEEVGNNIKHNENNTSKKSIY